MRRSLMLGHAAIDCINDTLAKVGREVRHVGRPPSPTDTMNQKPPDSAILKAIYRVEQRSSESGRQRGGVR